MLLGRQDFLGLGHALFAQLLHFLAGFIARRATLATVGLTEIRTRFFAQVFQFFFLLVGDRQSLGNFLLFENFQPIGLQIRLQFDLTEPFSLRRFQDFVELRLNFLLAVGQFGAKFGILGTPFVLR